MEIAFSRVKIKFQKVELAFFDVSVNSFALKNNKTLGETINTKRYVQFKQICLDKYAKYLNMQIGKFILELKSKGDNFYKNFLNKSGDLKYVNFEIIDKNLHNLKGLYLFKIKNEIVYIGRCRDSFKKRINNGYGRICPKNCYIDGQSTNCHVNNLIFSNSGKVDFYVSLQEDDSKISKYEEALIKKYNPKWNIQLKV